MCCKMRSLFISMWGFGPALRGGIVLALLAVPFIGCERENPREEPIPRLVVPIKKPIRQEPASPAKEAKDPGAGPSATRAESSAAGEKRAPAEKPAEAALPSPFSAPERGVYRVRKGETLVDIAGRREVYGDPLKWTVLLRANPELLDKAGSPKAIPTSSLQEGIAIRFVPLEEARENLKALGNKNWVVNVLSSREPERIYGPAVELARRGYRVYLTKGTVKGEEWLRLRVGFFGSREEAGVAGGEIRAKIPALQAWVLRIGAEELEAFGGY